MTIWVMWMTLIGFDGHNQSFPIPEMVYRTQAACETTIVNVLPRMIDLFPDEKANVKEIRLSCEPKSTK